MDTVIGLGEVLWDLFPTGKRLGGAPFNFCYHCHQLGAQGYPVSAVGTDALGEEIRATIASKGIPGEYIAELDDHPTGTVQVTLDEQGKPEYVINEGVAWDALPSSRALDELAGEAHAVCFGSLAQRAEVSRRTIARFLSAVKRDALRICDVNLRQPYYSGEILRTSLELCNVLKLSDEELPVIAGAFGLSGSVEQQLRALLDQFGLALIAYTRGAAGSLLLSPNEADDHSGHATKVVNSVGAGDSFTAALCLGLLHGRPLAEINDHANRVAAYVCTRDTATPELPAGLTLNPGETVPQTEDSP